MPSIYKIRTEKDGLFSIYENDQMVVYNLDSADVDSFCRDQKNSGSVILSPNSAYPEHKKPNYARFSTKGAGPGRKLILEPYMDIIKDMVEQDPNTTARDIERRLKALGIKFAALSAITNLARKHRIKLKA